MRIREEGRNIEPTFHKRLRRGRRKFNFRGDCDSRFRECRQNKADDTAKRSNQQAVAIRSSNFEFGAHKTRGRHEKQFSELGRGGYRTARGRLSDEIAPTSSRAYLSRISCLPRGALRRRVFREPRFELSVDGRSKKVTP